MRPSRTAGLLALGAAGAICLPPLAAGAGAAAASPQASPPIGRQLAELRGSGTVDGDMFGYAAAISGTTAVVGAYGHARFAGRAYVFTRTAAGWRQAASLTGAGTVTGDGFGTSVAASGTTVVVGASGHGNNSGRAYVFTKTRTGWRQAARLQVAGGRSNDFFGAAVAVSGTHAVVGAWGAAKDAGRAYVFSKTAAGWRQAAVLKGSDSAANDFFGASVAISGSTAVVGAPGPGTGADRAYVFTRTSTGWKQTAELKGADTVAGDAFGYSVAVSGGTAVVGAYGHARFAGRAYVFSKTKTGWKQAAELASSDARAGDMFGYRVAISGTTAVVGALNHANYSGRAYVFIKTAAGWTQAAELKGSDTVAGDEFGSSVAIWGTTAVVGAPGRAGSGRAYVFEG